MDAGSEGSPYSQVTTYDTTSFLMTHTVQWPADGVVTGQVYSFKFLAENSKGQSDFSEILSAAAIDPPAKASMPTIDYELSSSTSLFVSWARNTDGAAPGGLTTGYSLYMDDGYGGQFTEILFTAGTSPLISEYLVTDLTLSLTYRFYVVAYNYNPEPGTASDIASLQVCQKPSDWAAPTKLTTSQTSIAINWNEPHHNGGCSILGYAVFVDDGVSGSFIEANVDNDAAVRSKPSLSYL